MGGVLATNMLSASLMLEVCLVWKFSLLTGEIFCFSVSTGESPVWGGRKLSSVRLGWANKILSE